MKKRTIFVQRGFSLVELMVGIAISLVLSAIASSIFIGSVRSSRAQEERAKQDETAQLVMELLAREIKTAGFYPPFGTSTFTVGPKVGFVEQVFKGPETPNIVNPAWPAYDTGVFACEKAGFDRVNGQCSTAGQPSDPDTLVINYFSDDTFPQTANTFPGPGAGTRQDCLNQSVDALDHNKTRKGTTPVLVSNIYTLGAPQTYAGNNSNITTRSFGCLPFKATLPFQPFFTGVEQLRFRFGLFDNTTFQAPKRFYTIAEMNALPPLPIPQKRPSPFTPWERVVTIEVCVMTRSLENNAREAPAATVVNDCDGQPIAAIANQPRPIVSVNREVYNVRNASGFTVPLPPL